MYSQSSWSKTPRIQLNPRRVQGRRGKAFTGIQSPCSLRRKHGWTEDWGQGCTQAMLHQLPGPRRAERNQDDCVLLHQYRYLWVPEWRRLRCGDRRCERVARCAWKQRPHRPDRVWALLEGGYRPLHGKAAALLPSAPCGRTRVIKFIFVALGVNKLKKMLL